MENNAELVDKLASDYAGYLEVDVGKENSQFAASVEQMLTELEQYGGLVDLIRSDNKLALNSTLPQIYTKIQQMTPLFEKIDKLEEFVCMVSSDLDRVERLVTRAETEVGSPSSLQRLLTSLPAVFTPANKTTKSRAKANDETKTMSFVPPKIFRTSDHIVGATAPSSVQVAKCADPIGIASKTADEKLATSNNDNASAEVTNRENIPRDTNSTLATGSADDTESINTTVEPAKTLEQNIAE